MNPWPTIVNTFAVALTSVAALNVLSVAFVLKLFVISPSELTSNASGKSSPSLIIVVTMSNLLPTKFCTPTDKLEISANVKAFACSIADIVCLSWPLILI